MRTLLNIAEAAPQFKKTTQSMRWWLRQPDCPIKTIAIGGRRFLIQEQIDEFFDNAIKEAS